MQDSGFRIQDSGPRSEESETRDPGAGVRESGKRSKPASLNPESRILNPPGVALLAVMSAVAVMILAALAFSGSVQIETRTAIYRKQATQAYALAEGGVQDAILEIAYPPATEQQDKPRLWQKGQMFVRVPFQQGEARVEIVNETGKLDLNVAGRKQLARLFEARGLASDEAAQLAAAIDHWRSPGGSDDSESEALEDYYRNAGYRPAHERFGSLEEVLRVRGMSRDIFYGTAVVSPERRIRSEYGVGQDLTIYSGSPQVNVNYASKAVLLSLPGMVEGLAEPIVQERANKPFKSLEDLAQRLAISLPDEALPFLTTGETGIYSIISVGEVKGSRVRRTIRAVVQVASQGAARHRIVGWYDEAAY